MRLAFPRTAAVLAATTAILCLAATPSASAAPTGPVSLTASATKDGASIQLVYSVQGFGSKPVICTSRVKGAGETIVTETAIALFGATPVTVSPKTSGRYAITYMCTAGELISTSSSNGSPLYVRVKSGPPRGLIIFGS